MSGNAYRVLVTGGAGFIGSHLVEQLVTDGNEVTVIDDLSTGNPNNLESVRSDIELNVADLLDLLQSSQLTLEGYDIVYHLAANPYIPPSVERPEMDFRANLLTTFCLMEELRRCSAPPRLVNVSSGAVYGNPIKLPISESDPTVPISPYGVSKLAAERYVSVFCQLYGISSSSVRLFSVYGPRQKKQVVFDFMEKLKNNPQELEIVGDGSQSRDFVYVEDVVDALILLSNKASGEGEVYNVASGKSHSIAELARLVCKVCGLDPHITYIGALRPGDAEKWEVNINMISSIGFKSKTSLYDGLSAIRYWYDQLN